MHYSPPFFLFNPHLETIYPSIIRRVDFKFHRSVEIQTPDDDFLEFGMSTQQSKQLVIISHGLEGDNQRPYILGMARACFNAGYDVLAWNFRGCGNRMNWQLRFYHSGATDDLATIVQHAESLNQYMTLKYAGEGMPSIIKKVVGVSVPMDLKTSSEKLSLFGNRIYANRFLKSLKKKIITKAKVNSGLDVKGLESIKTLKDFDDRYTAPLHGFKNAEDYYFQCSSIRFIDKIKVPALIINALNDPFLSKECFPNELVKDHQFVKFESPARGGHVGFAQLYSKGLYWSEHRTISFLET